MVNFMAACCPNCSAFFNLTLDKQVLAKAEKSASEVGAGRIIRRTSRHFGLFRVNRSNCHQRFVADVSRNIL